MRATATLRRELGVVKWFAAIVDRAAGRCEICRNQVKGTLSLDHRHSCCGPDNVCRACARGLLCRACNAGLGMFQDSPALLAAAAAYLVEHDGSGDMPASVAS